MRPIPSTKDVGLAWLERMRWGASASGMAVLLVARVALGIDVPLALLLGLLAIAATTNVAFSVYVRRGDPRPEVPAFVLALDIVLLTLVLRASGGASNPFSALYVVYVTLGAVLLGARATWALVALAIAGFALLFVGLSPDAHAMHGMHGTSGMHQMPDGSWMQNGPGMGAPTSALDPFLSHLYGMLAAFAVSAVLIAFFVTRLSTALRARETELDRTREQSVRMARLASLTTLAAGAAHELGSPLGTIAVAAKELERTLRARSEDTLADEAKLVREEARRCRAILDGMAARAGETVGEVPVELDVAAIASDVVSRIGGEGNVRASVTIALEADVSPAIAPPRAVRSIVENLVMNAVDAAKARVSVRVRATEGGVRIVVEDDGVGMDETTLARAQEPFFTTKAEGRGMGLGLFLVATLVERLGGTFTLTSTRGVETRATVELPHRRPS